MTRAVAVTLSPLLLVAPHLRFSMWTGMSPWQFRRGGLLLVAIGFLLFALSVIHWLKGC